MPLDKRCSQAAVDANYSTLYKEGKRNPQLSAIVLNVLKRSCGVDKDSQMSAKEIIAAGSAKTEAKMQHWSRAGQKAKERKEKEKKEKGLAGKIRKGFKMVSSPMAAEGASPMAAEGAPGTRWVRFSDLFEGLPSSPAVRGLSFSFPGGMRGAGTSLSSASPDDSRGLAGGMAPPIPIVKCRKCGVAYNKAVGRCPGCGVGES